MIRYTYVYHVEKNILFQKKKSREEYLFSGVFLVNLTIFFFLILLYIVLIFFKDYYCSILVYHFLPLCNIEILRPIQYFLCFYLIKVILFLLVNKDERGF